MSRRFESLRRVGSMLGLLPRLLYHLCGCNSDRAFAEFLRWLPDDPGIWKRRTYLRPRLLACGENLVVLQGVWLFAPERISLGNNVAIAADVKINASGGFSAGNDVLIGPGSMIWTCNHRIADLNIPIRLQGYDYEPVTLGNDVWIGAQCMILPGVRIGDHAVIAAGSIVTKSVPPWAVAGGNPARVIKSRNDKVTATVCR